MRSLVRHAALGGLAGYAVAWLAAFLLLVGTPSLLGRSVVWSWTGGGELVAFIRLAGVLGAAAGAVIAALVALVRLRGRAASR